jgi:hypothetical protein
MHGDNLWMALAWKLPRRLVYWCAVRVGAHATTGAYSSQVVPDLTFTDALQRWPMGDDPTVPNAQAARTSAREHLQEQRRQA